MKILNYGSCNIDYVYQVDHITTVGETNRSYSRGVYAGGKGLNQSVALAKSGTTVFHAGEVGEDGVFLMDFMRAREIDTRYLHVSKTPTGHAIIQVDKEGKNAIFVSEGANFCVSRATVDAVLANFSAGDIITLQNEINHVGYIAEKARKKGMVVFFNPSPFNERVKEVDLNNVSFLIVNETEAEKIADFSSVRAFAAAVRAAYPGLKVLLTLGGKGSAYIGENELIESPAFRVVPADTTGAGDTFTGYFISCFAKNLPIKEALKTANAAAALCVCKAGAAESIPAANEVAAAVKTLKRTKDKTSSLSALAQAAVAENPAISLGELAKKLGYSENYLSKAIKRAAGVTFCRLKKSIRLNRAAELLAKTDLTIGEVIAQMGFSHEGRFHREFAAAFGETPLQYKRKHGQ